MSDLDPELRPLLQAAEPFQPDHRQARAMYAGLMLAMAVAALDQTIVATALPTTVGELGGLAHQRWHRRATRRMLRVRPSLRVKPPPVKGGGYDGCQEAACFGQAGACEAPMAESAGTSRQDVRAYAVWVRLVQPAAWMAVSIARMSS